MAEGKGLYSLTSVQRRSIDAVPFVALAVGAASYLMPFAALKENRVVDGVLMRGAALAGPLILVLGVLTAAMVIVAATQTAVSAASQDRRRAVYLAAGLMCAWLSAALLVRAGSFMADGAAPRVSPALGFWGLPAAAYILLDHAKPKRGKGRRIALSFALLLPIVLLFAGEGGQMVSVIREFSARRSRFLNESLVHLRLFSLAILFAGVIGIPLGILASSRRRLAGPLIAFVDGAQTIPSMALFGLLMAPMAALARAFPFLRTMGISGVGAAPALIALTLYAMLPVVRNTIAGLDGVSEAVLDVGRGMGMPSKQLFLRVRWPMALPYVLAGLRTASVQAVGNTAVAALIGAGGLGIMIFQGLGQAAPDLILLGVIPLILLAVAMDRVWGWLIGLWVSPGLRLEGG